MSNRFNITSSLNTDDNIAIVNNDANSLGQTNVQKESLGQTPFTPTNIFSPDQNKQPILQRTVYDSGINITNTPSPNTQLSSIFAPSSNVNDSEPILNRSGLLSSITTLPGGFSSFEQGAAILNTFGSFRGAGFSSISNFRDNILDKYSNVTYNFKLMLIPDSSKYGASMPSDANVFVIAQSGVSTNFYIKDVEITTIGSMNKQTRNSLATQFEIEIVEPLGVSLIDKIVSASASMNTKSIAGLPMLLELTFKGYDEAGRPVTIPGTKRHWKILLQDMGTNLTASGAEYRLTCILQNDYGFNKDSSAAKLKTPLSFSVSTVGKFFDDLGITLTEQDTFAAAGGNVTRKEYQFDVNPEMREWKIGESIDSANVASMFVEESGERRVVFRQGTSIHEIVDNIFASTKEANDMVNPASQPDLLSDPQRGNEVSKLVLISCVTKVLGYDPNNNDYIRRFTFFINKFDALRVMPEVPDTSGDEARARYILGDAMKKQYEYIFTGKNTNVLSLDIDLNMMWRLTGSYYTKSMHRRNSNNSNTITQVPVTESPDDVRPTESTLNQTSLSGLSGNGIQTQNTPFGLNQQSISSQTLITNDTQSKQRLADLRVSGLSRTQALESLISQQDAQSAIVPLEGGIIRPDNILSSEASRIVSNLTDFRLLEEVTQEKTDKILQFIIRENDPELDLSTIQENQEETLGFGRTIFGIIANQMYESQGGTLMEIEMNIKGDPYWLGETDQEQEQRLISHRSRGSGNGAFANYLRGEQSFFLTFRTPVGYNENTGMATLRDGDVFVGVYTVLSTVHKFSDGMFTQNISAIRDVNTNSLVIKRLMGKIINGVDNR